MRRSGLATTSGSAGTGPGNDTGVWLIITIILFALLCNYSRTICLIDVGTEGGICCGSSSGRKRWNNRLFSPGPCGGVNTRPRRSFTITNAATGPAELTATVGLSCLVAEHCWDPVGQAI